MAVVLTDNTYERIKSAVGWAEGERTSVPKKTDHYPEVEPVWVKVTSGTADGSGDYPGVVSLYRADGHTWEDLTATVRVRGISGETLTNGTRYASRPAGVTAGGEDLYVLLSSGSSGGIHVATVDELFIPVVDCNPTSYLAFRDSRGFDLSVPAGGVAYLSLRLASYSATGVVDTSSQSFAGTKTFGNGLIVQARGGDTLPPTLAFAGLSDGSVTPNAFISNIRDTTYPGYLQFQHVNRLNAHSTYLKFGVGVLNLVSGGDGAFFAVDNNQGEYAEVPYGTDGLLRFWGGILVDYFPGHVPPPIGFTGVLG